MRPALFIFILFALHGSLCAQDVDTLTAEDFETLDLSPVFGAESNGDTGGDSHELIPPDEMEATREYQADNISIRKFDQGKWKEIVGDEDFDEESSKRPEPQKSADVEKATVPWGGPLLKLISYIVIIGVVILLLYMVARNVAFDLRIKRTEFQAEDIRNVENIEDVDIQKLLEQARAEGNFKVAVRLYYLGLLKKLHELDAIVWKKDKTNRDYLSELFAKNFHFDDVRRLTNSYEAVWYGDHSLQPESFQRISSQFETVYEQMKKRESS